jgi:hypothetical protein
VTLTEDFFGNLTIALRRAPSAEPSERAVEARICDTALSFELKGYQAMSKTEHSQHTRDIMAALTELTEYRAAYAAERGKE